MNIEIHYAVVAGNIQHENRVECLIGYCKQNSMITDIIYVFFSGGSAKYLTMDYHNKLRHFTIYIHAGCSTRITNSDLLQCRNANSFS